MRDFKIVLLFLFSVAVLFPCWAEAKVRLPRVKPYRVQLSNVLKNGTWPRCIGSRIQRKLPKNICLSYSPENSSMQQLSFVKKGCFAVPTPELLRSSLAAHGYAQSADLASQYKQNLEQFLAAKKDLDAFIVYQQLEPRKLNLHERRYYEIIMEEADNALFGMKRMLGARSPAVHYGKIWLEEVRRVVNPELGRFIIGPGEDFLEQNLTPGRVYIEKEFLLKGKETKLPLFKTWSLEEVEEAKRLAEELPALSVAVLNDDLEILEWIQGAAVRGFLGKGTRVRGFSSMDALVDLWKAGVRYDVVLLDYVLEDGVSLYVANEIRALGDQNTVLLINSALEEKDIPSKELFNQGIDGFISSVGFRPDNVGPRLTHALYNYFSYKNKYGWPR